VLRRCPGLCDHFQARVRRRRAPMYDFYPAEWGPARNRTQVLTPDEPRDEDRDRPEDN